MKVNQIKAGTVISYLQMGLGIAISLFYTPVMIRMLGKSEYGLYNLAASTISMLSVLSLGFNSSYIRFYSKYKKSGNDKEISDLNGVFLSIFTVIGIIALACGLVISNNLNRVFDEGLSDAEYATARTLMILLTVNLAISFPMSVFTNIISAHERFIFLKLVGVLKTVLAPFLTLPLLLLGYRSVAMVVVTIVVALIADLLSGFFVFVKLKCRFTFGRIPFALIKELFTYTGFIAVNIIVDQINWNIDKVLLGRYIGADEVGVYSVGYTLYTYYMTFSSSISGFFTPRIHKMVLETETDPQLQRKRLTELFIKVGRIQFIVLGLIASGLVFFGKDFILNFWAGKEYSTSYYVMLLLVLPASIALIQNIGIEIQRAENKHSFRSLAYSIMAVLNLLMSIFLCQILGAVGSAIGTAISLVLCNGLIMNIYYDKKCNIDILKFWKSILRLSVGLIVPLICGFFMSTFASRDSMASFVIQILLYSVIYFVSMYFCAMNSYEKGISTKLLTLGFLGKGKNK